MPLNSHSDCRPKVCLFCFRKVSNRDLRKYPDYVNIIKNNLIDHYDETDVRFPCGICDTHVRSLNYFKKGLEGENTRSCFDFEKLSRYLKSDTKLKRKADACECLICSVATSGGFMEKLVLKKFEENSGENVTSSTDTSGSGSSVKLCGKCLYPIKKGLRGHICNQTNLIKNITNLLPENVRERLASDVIKRKMNDLGDVHVNLSTGGKDLNLDINIHKAGDLKEQVISHEHISRMKKRMNLSQNQTLILAEELRAVHANRKIVPSNLKSFLREKNKEFADIFEFENVEGEEVIYCTNVPEHIKRVSQKRGHTEPKLIKVGLDGGQGTLKCAASYLYESDAIFDLDSSEPTRKRRKYSEGLDVAKLCNNNGVNRVQLLALSTDSDENYEKLKFMFGKLELKPGSFLLCADLKVINISLNLMSHSARHPCPYCHWVKGSKSADAVLRTFEGITQNFETWLRETGGDRDKLKNYFNCQGPPLPIFPTSGLVCDYIPLSELHIMMGVTNKLVDELIKVIRFY